jgi:hypothetical protein
MSLSITSKSELSFLGLVVGPHSQSSLRENSMFLKILDLKMTPVECIQIFVSRLCKIVLIFNKRAVSIQKLDLSLPE